MAGINIILAVVSGLGFTSGGLTKTASGSLRSAIHAAAREVHAQPSLEESRAAIMTLDLDRSGYLEVNEVMEMAKTQGVTGDAMKEFLEMDKNGDQRLDAGELSPTLAQGSSEATAPAIAPSAAFSRAPQAMKQVGQDAGRLIAEAFARRAAESLMQRTADENLAMTLQNHAAKLRAQASLMVQGAAIKIKEAATKAAERELHKNTTKMIELDQRAADLEASAETRRKEAKIAMERVLKEQFDAYKQLHVLTK